MGRRIPLFPVETDTSPISGKQRSFDPADTVEVVKRVVLKKGEVIKPVCVRGVGCTACSRNPTASLRRDWMARVRTAKKMHADLLAIYQKSQPGGAYDPSGEPKLKLPPEPKGPATPNVPQGPQVYPPSDPKSTDTLLVVLSNLSFGDSANWLAYTIQQCGWTGWVVIDLAVKCGAGKPSDNHITACSPYLKHTLKLSGARRILVCGTPASKAVTGNTMHPWNHGSWTHVPSIEIDGQDEPRGRTLVVSAPDPADAWRNRFIGNIMRAAIKRACFMDIPEGLPTDVHALQVTSKKDLADFMEWVKGVPYVSYDVEWTGVPYNKDFKMVAGSFSHPDWNTVWLFDEAVLEKAPVHDALRWVLTNVPIVAQNISAEFEASQCFFGVEIAEVYGDTLPGFKLLNVDSKASLEDLAYYIGYNSHKAEMDAAMAAVMDKAAARVPPGVRGASPKSYIMDLVDPTTMLRYNALDTFITGELHEELMRRFDVPKRKFMKGTYDVFIRPALKLLHRVHHTGMLIDQRALTITRKRLGENLDRVEAMLKHKGIDDPNSVAQIRQYLIENEMFSKLEEQLRYDVRGNLVDEKVYERKLAKYKSAKTGEMSTGKHTLKVMKDWDGKGVIADLLEYREKSKLLVSYGQALHEFIRDDGRIHPYYRLDGAKTGRLASAYPSSHQVPKHGENATLIKSVYVAPNGWCYVAFDYKTLEVFIAAIQSGDTAMMAACREEDFHLETAKKMAPYAWKCTPEQVEAEVRAGDKSKRTAAKGITFSILYGAGAFALADTLKCSIEVAEALLAAYAAAYPQFSAWVRAQHAFAAAHGFVHVPWLGEPSRIRPLLHAGFTSSEERGRYNQAMRQAVNTPVQGTAAQYGLLAAIDLEEQFRREKMPAAVNAMVHDSIMVECHPSVLDEVIPRMFYAMTQLPTGTDLRLQVDAEVGDTWGSLEPIDLVKYVGVAA